MAGLEKDRKAWVIMGGWMVVDYRLMDIGLG